MCLGQRSVGSMKGPGGQVKQGRAAVGGLMRGNAHGGEMVQDASKEPTICSVRDGLCVLQFFSCFCGENVLCSGF